MFVDVYVFSSYSGVHARLCSCVSDIMAPDGTSPCAEAPRKGEPILMYVKLKTKTSEAKVTEISKYDC